jgi:hypothetical protein
MMSCTASAAWSRHVFSPCYTEHDQRCGVILSGRITTIAIYRSGQLGLRCTVEPNCSGMSARLAGALVTRDRGPRGSAGAHIGREARSGAEEHMTASELNSARR